MGFVCDPFETNTTDWPEVKTNDGQLEPLALYEEKVMRMWEGHSHSGYRVNVVKNDGSSPERFKKHMGKIVEANGVMWK